MNKIHTVAGLLVFLCMMGIPAIQFSHGENADIQSQKNQWYPGINLSDGDYFKYDFCHVDYFECKPVTIELIVADQTYDYWDMQVTITESDSEIKGNAKLFKDQMSFVASDSAVDKFSSILDRSFVWLNNFTNVNDPKKVAMDEDWGKIGNIGGERLKVISDNESSSINSKVVDASILGWSVGGKTSKIWIVNDFPFPVQAETFVHVGKLPIDYKFQLIEYQSNAKKMNHVVLSPLKHLKTGMVDSPQDIICREDLMLVLRDNGKLACVKESTAERFGWNVAEATMQSKLKQETSVMAKPITNNNEKYNLANPLSNLTQKEIANKIAAVFDDELDDEKKYSDDAAKFITKKGRISFDVMGGTFQNRHISYTINEQIHINPQDNSPEIIDSILDELRYNIDEKNTTKWNNKSYGKTNYFLAQSVNDTGIRNNKITFIFGGDHTTLHLGNWHNNLSELKTPYTIEHVKETMYQYAISESGTQDLQQVKKCNLEPEYPENIALQIIDNSIMYVADVGNCSSSLEPNGDNATSIPIPWMEVMMGIDNDKILNWQINYPMEG